MKDEMLVGSIEIYGIREGDLVTMSGRVAKVVKVNDATTLTIKWLTWYERLWRWAKSMRRLFIDPWLPRNRAARIQKQKDDEARAYIKETQPKIAAGFRSLAEQRAKLAELRETNDVVGE